MNEAVIFAAGQGRRLRPLTDHRPKALVEVDGVPMLERVARRLVAAGARRLVVNVHPFADQIRAYVEAHGGFGVEVVLSHERERPLETGGGLRAARPLLRADAPILVHNVDVLTDLALERIVQAHAASDSLVTLAVMERASSRQLLFDDEGLLGRIDRAKEVDRRVRTPHGPVRERAFSGIHVFAPAFLDRITERGVFSITETWLRLAREGARIRPFEMDDCRWIDVGRPEDLERARGL